LSNDEANSVDPALAERHVERNGLLLQSLETKRLNAPRNEHQPSISSIDAINLSNLGVAMTPLPIMAGGNLRGLGLGRRGLETGITIARR
jgi:hypothetical protein